jgi:hypothetical protein
VSQTHIQIKTVFAELGDIRYVGASWDLGEVVAAKDDIVSKNLLVTKLAVPKNVK